MEGAPRFMAQNAAVMTSLLARRNTAAFSSSTIYVRHRNGANSGVAATKKGSRAISGISRAFPQYSVYGPNCVLGFKPILPTYKRVGNDALAIDRLGRMLVEFIPRGSKGHLLPKAKEFYSLSVDEVGQLLSKLPDRKLELCRKEGGINVKSAHSYGSIDTEGPDTILCAEPSEDGSVMFTLDFVKDGIGGQPSRHGGGTNGPLEITVNAGEVQVITAILRDSISHLTGWNVMMKISSEQKAFWDVQDGKSVPF